MPPSPNTTCVAISLRTFHKGNWTTNNVIIPDYYKSILYDLFCAYCGDPNLQLIVVKNLQTEKWELFQSFFLRHIFISTPRRSVKLVYHRYDILLIFYVMKWRNMTSHIFFGIIFSVYENLVNDESSFFNQKIFFEW